MSEFNLLDWIVVLIVVYSIVTSIIRGFVREVLGLATVVAGLLVAAWFHERIAAILVRVVQTEGQALFAGFVILFGTTLLAGYFLIRTIQKFVQFAHIEWFDRLLGAAFGFLRGWLVAAILFLTLTSFGVLADAVRSSRLSPYFLPAVRALATITPFDLKARFLIGYEEVERWWNEQLLGGQSEEDAGASPTAP